MADAVPFLDLDGRVGYLYERNYFPQGTVTAEHRERLSSMNFHYFLGYARNYRLLTAQGLPCNQQATPDDVFMMIDHDHEVAKLLYQGLRQAEWNLRALAVEHYCAAHEPCGSFLREQQYLCTAPGSEADTVRGIINSVLRHGEPFVEDHIDTQAAQRGAERPKKYEQHRHEELVGYIEDLPLWSVIDSFSLGLLSRFITQCDKPSSPDDAIWKKVADGLEIRHPVFLTNIESLTVLRNLVSHHARMWMRPTTVSPKKPRAFEKYLREADPKSMEVAFANVALFQGPRFAKGYLDEVLALVSREPLYKHGVTKVRNAKALATPSTW